MKNLLEKLKVQLFAKWVACSLISDKRSVQYGIRFSYPIYILIVFAGISLESRFILLLAALIAFLAIKFPLHPLDYVYNGIARLIGFSVIPGRGSELQVNSFIAVVLNLVVFTLITFEVSINYGVLAVIYALSSVFFLAIFLLKD